MTLLMGTAKATPFPPRMLENFCSSTFMISSTRSSRTTLTKTVLWILRPSISTNSEVAVPLPASVCWKNSVSLLAFQIAYWPPTGEIWSWEANPLDFSFDLYYNKLINSKYS